MPFHRYLPVSRSLRARRGVVCASPSEPIGHDSQQYRLSKEVKRSPLSMPDFQRKRQSYQSLGDLERRAIAIIGYQLWTPLSAIKACLELLESPEEIEPGERQFMVELALQETVGLEELVRECLALFVEVESPDRTDEVTRGTACPLLPTLELLQEALSDAASRCFRREMSESARPTTICEGSKGKFGEQITVCEVDRAPATIATVSEREEHHQILRHKLTAIVGHELRTPLCSLKVCLETFLGDSQQFRGDDMSTLLELARTDLERLRQLVEQFFTLSRLERGLILHTRAVVDLAKTLDVVVSGLRTQYRAIPQVGLNIPQDIPLLRVDEDKLLLALGQLIDNAFRFTEVDGRVTIEVRPFQPERTVTEHHLLEIVVADTGRGIDPTRLEQVFDCFYQEEDFLRRTVGGTGIGLSICRKLVEAMGGTIWAHSSGKALGSRIHLTLPTVGYCAV